MTITDLADRANIDRSAMTNIVNDAIGLGPTRAKRVAEALGVSVPEVRQPPEEDAGSRRDLGRRLESLAGKVADAIEDLNALGSRIDGLEKRLAVLEAPRRRPRGAPKRQEAGPG